MKTAEKKDALIFFCPAENHRGEEEHAHAMGSRGDICVVGNRKMMEVLRQALDQGTSGDVPYSSKAMAALRDQIAKRSFQPRP